MLSAQSASNLSSAARGELEKDIEAAEQAAESMRGARGAIMTYGAFYPIAGLLAAVFWVWGFRLGPKWLSLIFVPVPVYGAFLLICVM